MDCSRERLACLVDNRKRRRTSAIAFEKGGKKGKKVSTNVAKLKKAKRVIFGGKPKAIPYGGKKKTVREKGTWYSYLGEAKRPNKRKG